MKRTVIIFISLLFILSACGGKESKENKEKSFHFGEKRKVNKGAL